MRSKKHFSAKVRSFCLYIPLCLSAARCSYDVFCVNDVDTLSYPDFIIMGDRIVLFISVVNPSDMSIDSHRLLQISIVNGVC